MVRRRGYEKIRGLAIVADSNIDLPKKWSSIRWSEVYRWLSSRPRKTVWHRELVNYFEVLEAQLVREDALGKRAITQFNGIHFNAADPFSYAEAKRLLKLLREQLLSEKSSLKILGVKDAEVGRSSITDQPVLWDFLAINANRAGRNFTSHPHFTFAIGSSNASAMVTVPNAVKGNIYRQLKNASAVEFADALDSFQKKLSRETKGIDGIRPTIRIMQRHYRTQRSKATIDGILDFDLRTANSNGNRRNTPKYQPEWVAMALPILKYKRSNIQFQIGCEFEYGQCKKLRYTDSHLLFLKSWIASRKFFTALKIEI